MVYMQLCELLENAKARKATLEHRVAIAKMHRNIQWKKLEDIENNYRQHIRDDIYQQVWKDYDHAEDVYCALDMKLAKIAEITEHLEDICTLMAEYQQIKLK